MNQETFLMLTSLQWNALGVIATFFVSCIAIFLPLYLERRNINEMLKIVEKEVEENYKKLKNAVGLQDTIPLPTGTNTQITVSKIQVQMGITEHVTLKSWYEFRGKLAVNEPQFFNKYRELMESIESLLSDQEKIKEGEKQLIPRFQDSIKNFVGGYEKLNKLI
jgi:hypothetical protein